MKKRKPIKMSMEGFEVVEKKTVRGENSARMSVARDHHQSQTGVACSPLRGSGPSLLNTMLSTQ